MGLRYVRYEFHYNFRETSSVVISRRTKDCFGTSHLFRGPCIVFRGFRRGDQPLPAYRTYCWDHRKLNTEYLLFTEGRGGLTILQSKQKGTEIKKLQYFNVEPTDKSSPSAPTSSTGHQIWPFSDLVSYYESMIDSYIPLPFPFFLGCNSDYILFSKELHLRRWRMDAGHGE